MGEFKRLAKGAVGPEVGRDERVFDPHGGIDHRPVGNQAHASDHGVEPDQCGDVFCLAGQGVSKEARGLGDEVAAKRLQLGLFGLAMRVAKLGPLRTLWGCVSVLLIAPVVAWAAMALWFRLPAPEWAKVAAASALALIAIATVVAFFTRRRWAALLVFGLAFGGVVIWWNTVQPAADGDWAPDVARQTTGTLNGDILTLSDVRDFDWRTDDDFTERWSPRSYDLSKLTHEVANEVSPPMIAPASAANAEI